MGNPLWIGEYRKPFDGYHLIFHDPFEFPTPESAHYYTRTFRSLTFLISPELVSIDDSLVGMTPDEYEEKVVQVRI